MSTQPARSFTHRVGNKPRNPHYTRPLSEADPEIAALIAKEENRQETTIELIASENNASFAAMQAQGSVLTNKYAEGQPGKRFYNGCEFVDQIEKIAKDRACKLFDCGYANVQPHSGAQANEAVYAALLKPGDTFMGMALDAGGHLSHGADANDSSKKYESVQYGRRTNKDGTPNNDGTINPDGSLNYDKIEELALKTMPKLIVAGASSYSRQIDFKRFRKIADKVTAKMRETDPKAKCYYMVDMAHYAGLVAGGEYDSPIPYADVVTSTTHKSLRGPRAGLILAKDPNMEIIDPHKDTPRKLGAALNSAVFPGVQGGPLMHVIAAKAVCFGEALKPEFKEYARNVRENAEVLAETLKSRGVQIVMDGTESHVMTVDLRSSDPAHKPVNGLDLADTMDRAGLTANKNSVPGDTEFVKTSGVRLGTSAATTRGFGKDEFRQIGNWVADLVDAMRQGKDTAELEKQIRGEVHEMCERFPTYESTQAPRKGRSPCDE